VLISARSSPPGQSTTEIVDRLVPVGAKALIVKDISSFAPGDRVFVERDATPEWIAAMEMDRLERNGKAQTWLAPGSVIRHTRTVVAVDAAKRIVSIDSPLVDAIDAVFGPGRLTRYRFAPGSSSQTTDCGIESLVILLAPSHSSDPVNQNPTFVGLSFRPFVEDCWASAVSLKGFTASVIIDQDARRLTLRDVAVHRTAPTKRNESKGLPFDYEIRGSQILLLRCSTHGEPNTHSYTVVTQSRIMGPNALVDFMTEQTCHVVSTHQRWAAGFLIDGGRMGKIELSNRKHLGSGHGWT
jgi:hypothetical protein